MPCEPFQLTFVTLSDAHCNRIVTYKRYDLSAVDAHGKLPPLLRKAVVPIVTSSCNIFGVPAWDQELSAGATGWFGMDPQVAAFKDRGNWPCARRPFP